MNFFKKLINSKNIDNTFVFFIFINLYNVFLNINIKQNAIMILVVTILFWIVSTWLNTRKKMICNYF